MTHDDGVSSKPSGRKPGYFGDGPDGNDPLRPDDLNEHPRCGVCFSWLSSNGECHVCNSRSFRQQEDVAVQIMKAAATKTEQMILDAGGKKVVEIQDEVVYNVPADKINDLTKLFNGKPIMEIVDDEPLQTLTQSVQRTARDYAKVNGVSIDEARRLLKEREEANLMNLADKFGID
jgi:hypothetical protein